MHFTPQYNVQVPQGIFLTWTQHRTGVEVSDWTFLFSLTTLVGGKCSHHCAIPAPPNFDDNDLFVPKKKEITINCDLNKKVVCMEPEILNYDDRPAIVEWQMFTFNLFDQVK